MNRASQESFRTTVARMIGILASRIHKGFERRRSARRLRLSETLSLGEKRFLAVVQFGGTGTSIALLARLDAPKATPAAPAGLRDIGH